MGEELLEGTQPTDEEDEENDIDEEEAEVGSPGRPEDEDEAGRAWCRLDPASGAGG